MEHVDTRIAPTHFASNKSLKSAVIATVLSLAGVAPDARADDDEGWQWIVAPYAWLVTIGTDVERTEPPAGGISSDTSFDDVLDKFDGAFQVHAEGQNERWGMFTDFTYLGLADEKDFERFSTESDFDARLFELAAVWNPSEGRYRGLDLFAGLRYIDLDFTVRFDPLNTAFESTTFNGGDSYSDFMFGARYTWALSERWALTVRGDASTGDTEGTWNTSGTLSYRTNSGAWLFGYRYLAIELESGDTNTDFTVSGPLIGYGFVF